MKRITIHKKNEMIRGSDSYSMNAKKAMNAIYYGLQKHRDIGAYKGDFINIRFSILRKLMTLEKDNNYTEVMKDALLELQQPFELNHFYHPIDEVEYHWYSTSFLQSVGFKKNDDGEWIAVIEVGRLSKYVMQVKGNFTPLDLIPVANSFRTKYAMKLYEYLESFGGYSYINITQKHMMKLLALDEKSSYKYYGDLQRLIERQLKEIAKKSNLKEVKLIKSKTLAKEKIFKIIISPKSKKTVDAIKAKTALDNLIKRF